MRVLLLSLASALSVACQSQTPARSEAAPRTEARTASATSVAASTPEVAERRFGAPPKLEGAPLPVDQLLANPEPHLGKNVKCEGKVARVCQNAGCWLEIQTEAGAGLRVPMAGHSFFIPKDAVGHVAVVEGELRRVELAANEREHYQSEGMKAVGPLSLEATSVVLR